MPPVLNQIQEAVVLEHQGHLCSIRYMQGSRASRPPVLNQIQEAVVLEHQCHLCSIRYRRQWY